MNRCPKCWLIETAPAAEDCEIADCPQAFEPDVMERERIPIIRAAMAGNDYRSERTKAIVARLNAGEHAEMLAEEFGICRSRVYQLRSQDKARKAVGKTCGAFRS